MRCVPPQLARGVVYPEANLIHKTRANLVGVDDRWESISMKEVSSVEAGAWARRPRMTPCVEVPK